MASEPPDLRLPSQSQGITAHWLVPNYTAWWQRHMCVNNLPRVAFDGVEAGNRTRDLLIASPASQPLGHQATHIGVIKFPGPSLWLVGSRSINLSLSSPPLPPPSPSPSPRLWAWRVLRSTKNNTYLGAKTAKTLTSNNSTAASPNFRGLSAIVELDVLYRPMTSFRITYLRFHR